VDSLPHVLSLVGTACERVPHELLATVFGSPELVFITHFEAPIPDEFLAQWAGELVLAPIVCTTDLVSSTFFQAPLTHKLFTPWTLVTGALNNSSLVGPAGEGVPHELLTMVFGSPELIFVTLFETLVTDKFFARWTLLFCRRRKIKRRRRLNR
jgi:hypothetical protein